MGCMGAHCGAGISGSRGTSAGAEEGHLRPEATARSGGGLRCSPPSRGGCQSWVLLNRDVCVCMCARVLRGGGRWPQSSLQGRAVTLIIIS
jgi:hypothetical protein